MRTEAKNFHPMRGHVEDGAEILMADGSVLTIRSRLVGWVLTDKAGTPVCPVVDNCWDLTSQVVTMDREAAAKPADPAEEQGS